MAGHELSITRLIAAPREAVWRAWRDRMGDWFAPRPWTAEILERDLRAGGGFSVRMRGPAGEEATHGGVYLQIVPGERVVLTDAFMPGWVPQGPFMVSILDFADADGGTRYTATVRHWTEGAMERHRAMGFETGWSIVADQLAEVATAIAR